MAKKILIVEDEPDILQMLKSALERSAYQVVTCENGRECLERLKSDRPDLLLLDVMLPGIDGYSLQLKIAQDEETKDLPIVVLTGLEPSRTLFRRSPQVVAFLTKPFKAEELVSVVGQALASRG